MNILLRTGARNRHPMHICFSFFWHICFHCYFVGVSVLCNPAISVGLQGKEVKGREQQFPCFWFYNSINNQESENVRDSGWLKGCRSLHFWGHSFGPVTSQEWLMVCVGKPWNELFRTFWWSFSTLPGATCFLHARCGWEPPCYLSIHNKALNSSVRLILLDINEACCESSVAVLTSSVLLVLRQ